MACVPNMKKTAYRVRFAPDNRYQRLQADPAPSQTCSVVARRSPWARSSFSPTRDSKEPRSKSKSGCKECKIRRVKCDETFPVCIRCQRRGSLCLSATPPVQWQTEMPWMVERPVLEPWVGVVNPNKRLLQYWLEKTSRIMALNPDDNPLSFPLIEHLLSTPSLVHAVQSISAGQENFFRQSSLELCLAERGLAMQSLQLEVNDPNNIKPSSLLTVFLLGISWTWTEDHPTSYGKEHLLGAKTLLEKMLVDEQKRECPLVQFMLGWYIYWDMSCSFIAEPGDVSPLNIFDIFSSLQSMRSSYHPMIGFSAELLHLVACLGRHCRKVMQSGVRDPTLEGIFEEQLKAWKPDGDDKDLVYLSNAYRNHGLIMLYEICGVPTHNQHLGQSLDDGLNTSTDPSHIIHALALESLQEMFQTPVDVPCFCYHSIPLLTAGAELQRGDSQLRVEVINRFKALFSTTRLSINMWAISLLQDTWELRDCGIHVSWLDSLIFQDWILTFA
ncbi:fungal-specific transcription factor domain-containing protein [Fusarium solani]|uniref:Fungal-specific transcription factor domain-containing protein n=2 Tax=Fusarium solani TaxID=169388 RepID=A0A9P9GK78_FUSSL|nr:fungal-specific transcription factor domain-containing protein [Fusarium solani]KAH7240456.1 fungal-specific transcription factor domain-containing protein [Fusarium solani]